MKLLIPALLLTLVAVGSTIMKVSERGARTAQAAASNQDAATTKQTKTVGETAKNGNELNTRPETKSIPARVAERFVSDQDEDRATTGPDESAGPWFTFSVEPGHLGIANSPGMVQQFFRRENPSWSVRAIGEAGTGKLKISLRESGYEPVRDILKWADQLNGDNAAQTDLDALRTSADLVKVGKPRHYVLKRVNAGEMAGALRDVLSPDGKPRLALHADPHHRQLYVSAPESLLDAISRFVAEVESPIPEGSGPGEVRTIEIKASRIERDKLAEIVRKLFAASDFNEKLKIRTEPDRPSVSLTAPQATCVRVGNVVDALNAAVEVAYAEPQVPPALPAPAETTDRPAHPVRLIALKYCEPSKLANVLKQLHPNLVERGVIISASPEGHDLRIRSDRESFDELYKTVLQMEESAKSRQVQADFDREAHGSQTKLFTLQKSQASAVKALLNTLYPNANIAIAADDRSNTLVVRGAGDQLNEFEAIITRLDESPTQAPASPARTNASPVEAAPSAGTDPPADRRQLAQAFRDLDQKAATLAEEIRDWHTVDSDTEAPQIAPLTGQLLSTVSQAFEARQRWQIAELAVLRARLERLDREIKSREQAKMQIIEQRTRELIEGKSEESDVPDAHDDDRASSRRAPSGTDGNAAPVSESSRAALEGRIAEAERALVRDNIDIQKRRAELDQRQLDPKAVDVALQRLFAEDEPLRQYGALLEERKKKVYELKSGSPERQELKQDIIRIETSVASRQSELRPAAEEIVLREGREWLRKAQEAVKRKQRLVNQWKHQLREALPVRDAALDAAPLASERGIVSSDPRQTVDHSVRTALLTKLAEAETELELERIRVQTQREKFERFAQNQPFLEEALREVLSADPRYVESAKSIEELSQKMASLAPTKMRAEVEKRHSEGVTRLEALKAQIWEEHKQSVIARERAKVEREEESVKSKERYVELLKKKLRERKESGTTSPALPSSSTAPRASGAAALAGDSVRTFLLDTIAKAEVDLWRTKIEVQEARDVQESKDPETFDTEVGYRFAADPEVSRLRKSIGQLKDEFNALKPGTPTTEDSTIKLTNLEKELESRIAELRPAAEHNVRTNYTKKIEVLDRDLRRKERAVELLKKQLREREEAASKTKSHQTVESQGAGSISAPEMVRTIRQESADPISPDRLRSDLQRRLAEAEIKLKLTADWYGAQQAEVEVQTAQFQIPDEELTKRIRADNEMRDLERKRAEYEQKMGATTGKEREILAEEEARLKRLLTSRRNTLLPQVREQAKRAAYKWLYDSLAQTRIEIESQKRRMEVLKKQLAELPPAGEELSTSAKQEQYRRAAGIWMSDVEAAAARAQELKRPLLIYTDPQMQTLDLESEKEWMALPEVLDLLEKSFVAVRFRSEENATADQAQSFPIVEIADFFPSKTGVQGKRRAALAKFHYDKRFLDLLQKIAAEYEGISIAEGSKRSAPGTADEMSRDVEEHAESITSSLRERLLAARAEVETAMEGANKARAALKRQVAVYDKGRASGLKEGDSDEKALKSAVSEFENELARVTTLLQTKKTRVGQLEDELRVRVRLLELDLSDSEARLQKAKADFERTQKLVERGAAIRTALDDEQLKLKQAESAVERAKLQLDLYRRAIVPDSTNEPRPDGAAKPAEPPLQPDAEPSNPGAAVPRGAADKLAAVDDVVDEFSPGANRKRPNPYKYDKGAYGWLRGTISKDNASRAWRLQYIDRQGEGDLFGGSLQLTGSPKLDELVEDDVVYVRGKIDSAVKDRDGRPLYRVESLDILKPTTK